MLLTDDEKKYIERRTRGKRFAAMTKPLYYQVEDDLFLVSPRPNNKSWMLVDNLDDKKRKKSIDDYDEIKVCLKEKNENFSKAINENPELKDKQLEDLLKSEEIQYVLLKAEEQFLSPQKKGPVSKPSSLSSVSEISVSPTATQFSDSSLERSTFSAVSKTKTLIVEQFVDRGIDLGFFKFVGVDVKGDVKLFKNPPRRLSKLDIQGVHFLNDFNVSDCNLSGAKFSKSNIRKLEGTDESTFSGAIGRESSFGSFTFNHRTKFSGFLANTQKESIKKMFEMTQGAIAYSFKASPTIIKEGYEFSAVKDHEIVLKGIENSQNSEKSLFVKVSDGEVAFPLDEFLTKFQEKYAAVKKSKNFLSNFFKGEDMLVQLGKLKSAEHKVRYLIAHIHAEPNSRTAQAMRAMLPELEMEAGNMLDEQARKKQDEKLDRVVPGSSLSTSPVPSLGFVSPLNFSDAIGASPFASSLTLSASSKISPRPPLDEQELQRERDLIAQSKQDRKNDEADRVATNALTSRLADFPPMTAMIENNEKAARGNLLAKSETTFQDMKKQQKIALLMSEQEKDRARLVGEAQVEFESLEQQANVDREKQRQKLIDRRNGLSSSFQVVLKSLVGKVNELQKAFPVVQVITMDDKTKLFGKESSIKFSSDEEFLKYANEKAEKAISSWSWGSAEKREKFVNTQFADFNHLKTLYLELDTIFNLPILSEDVTEKTYIQIGNRFSDLLKSVDKIQRNSTLSDDFKNSLRGLADEIKYVHREWERRKNIHYPEKSVSSPAPSTFRM